MNNFEEAFQETELMAESTLKAAASVNRAAKALQKAAQTGNINRIKRSKEQLKENLSTLSLEVGNTLKTGSFSDDDVPEYMKTHYSEEILSHSREIGLEISEKDGVLISYPSTIQVLHKDGALRIDGKKVSDLRPSRLVSELKRNQEKGSKLNTTRFLEGLFKAYKILSRSDQSTGSSPVVTLQDIYEVFTSLPGVSNEYSKMDFARDVYLIDSGELRRTRDGSTVSFPAARGLAVGRNVIPFVGRDGTPLHYYGIKFTRAPT